MPSPNARFLITADDKASAKLRKIKGELTDTTRSVKGLAAQFGLAFGAGAVVTGIVNVALETEKLRASLETVTGSAAAANAAFDDIKKFTTETPFQINEVASSFIKLSAYGIEPTERLLRSLGNTASAMGKTLDQSVEALADAATGEFERLKEFGIKARSEGDKVAFTFRGVTTEVGKNADEIKDYLQSIGETDFAGAMDRQMATLGGAFSNLQDSVYNLADQVANESGLVGALKEATKWLTTVTNEAGAAENAFQKLGKGLGVAAGQLAVGENTIAASRLERIKGLEELAGQLEQQIEFKRENLAAANTEREEKRLIHTRNLITELRKSLNDPEFQNLNRGGIIRRLPDTRSTDAGPKIKFSSGGGGGPSSSEKKAAAKAARDAATAEREYQRALQSLRDELDPVAAETRAYVEAVDLLDKAWTRGDISGEEYDRLILTLATDTEKLRLEEEKLQAQRDRAVGIIKSFDPTSGISDQIAEVAKLRDLFPDLADQLDDVSLKLGEKFDEIGEKSEEAADKTKDAWQELGPVFSSAFEDAIVEGKNFSDVLEGLEKDIIRIATRKLVTEPLGGFFSDFFSGGGAGGGFLSGIFKRAEGGPLRPGMPHLVGEEGPELIIPRTPGTVLSAKQTAARGGGVTINLNGVTDFDSFRRNETQLRRAAQQFAGA